MIEITVKKSNNIIKKGDFFSIYVNIINGHEKEITIKEVKLFQPTGFILAEHTHGIERGMFSTAAEFFTPFFKFRIGPSPAETSGTPHIPTPGEALIGPYIVHKPEVKIQAKGTYREDFNLKAGWSAGLRPRADTYTISGEVMYETEDKTFYKSQDIEVSIFPSMGSMLAGTLVGSALGTIVKVLTEPKSFSAELVSNGRVLESWIDAYAVVSILFVNLILGLLIGIILMRKKDVQPFLTVEDFWGGVLLGFLVGYLGIQFLFQFGNFSSTVPGNVATNVTGT